MLTDTMEDQIIFVFMPLVNKRIIILLKNNYYSQIWSVLVV